MAVTTYKCDPRALFGEQTMTIVPSGTAVAALTKAQDHTETPATEPRLTSATNAQKGFYLFAASAALKTALEAGGLVVGVALWARVENRSATGKNFKLAYAEPNFGTTALEPELVKTTPAWVSLAVPKAEAEANLNTVAKIEAARVQIEHLTAKELWITALYLAVEVEESAAKKVAGAVTSGASTSASTQRIAQPPASGAAGVTGHVRMAATLARLAKASATVSGGATVTASVVKIEHGPQAAKLSTGAVVAATLARQARASAALSTGASVSAQTSRKAASAAALSAGASVRASTQRISQPLTRVAGGAVVTATIRRVAKVTARVSAGATAAAAVSKRLPITAHVSGGASVYATVTRVGQSPEPPTSTPVAGHVAVGQRGTIGVHRGRIATGNIGRAER